MLPDFLRSGLRPRIGVIINPYSGGNRKDLGAIRNIIAQYPQVFHFDVQTPRDVLAALKEFAAKNVELVVVSGGDGTVQAVLTVLFHHQPFTALPLMAIFQSGTTSMTARDVGFQGSPVKALEKVFRWATAGGGDPSIIERPVLQVRAPGQDIRYGMFFGAAGIYQGIQYFHRNVNSRGLGGEVGPGLTLIRFLWAVIRKDSELVSSVPITVALDDNTTRQLDCLVILISTLERLFLGLHPYLGSETGLLHYTALTTRPRHLLRVLPSILRGRKSDYGTPQNGYFSHNAHEIRLNLDSGFTLDGQLYTPGNSQDSIVVKYGGTARFLRL